MGEMKVAGGCGRKVEESHLGALPGLGRAGDTCWRAVSCRETGVGGPHKGKRVFQRLIVTFREWPRAQRDCHWDCRCREAKKGGTGHCGSGDSGQLGGRGRLGPMAMCPALWRTGAGTGTSSRVPGPDEGRLPGLGLEETKPTWDSPGSPLLPALPRRPGGPGQENKDRLVEKGSQWAWAQPLPRPTSHRPPSPSRSWFTPSLTSHSPPEETNPRKRRRQKSLEQRNLVWEKNKAEVESPLTRALTSAF